MWVRCGPDVYYLLFTITETSEGHIWHSYGNRRSLISLVARFWHCTVMPEDAFTRTRHMKPELATCGPDVKCLQGTGEEKEYWLPQVVSVPDSKSSMLPTGPSSNVVTDSQSPQPLN